MQSLKNIPSAGSALTFAAPPLLALTSLRPCSLLTRGRLKKITSLSPRQGFCTTSPLKMSFSNTDTGNKPADPYKEKNLTSPDLKTKVVDLVKFVEASKFGMMTTRIESSGLLTSRCMALAAKVCCSLRNVLLVPPSTRTICSN